MTVAMAIPNQPAQAFVAEGAAIYRRQLLAESHMEQA
jgi:hypothetical protein